MSKLSRTIVTVIPILIVALSVPARISDAAAAQDRGLIGAYDPAHINGIVFIANDQNFFAFRILVYRQGTSHEDSPRSFDFGPYAPDGSFAKVSWRPQIPQYDVNSPVILRWGRTGKNVVIGAITAPSSVSVAIEVYRPWSQPNINESQATFGAQPDQRTILGEQVQNQRGAQLLRRFFLRTDGTATGAASYDDTAAMRKVLTSEGHAQQAGQPQRPGLNRHAALSFDFSQNKPVGFVAMVGDNFDVMGREAEKILQKPIAEQLLDAEKNYDSAKTRSNGALGESFEAISRLVNWNRYYNPEKQLEYVTLYRLPERQANSETNKSQGGTVLSWDAFLTGMMTSLIDRNTALGTIHSILEGQLPDGRVPLRRHLQNQPRNESATLAGRTMPPIGALCVWKVYLSTNDLGLLAWAYPRLSQWNDWWLTNRGDGQAWRDGNGDSLLEWGFDAETELGALGARATRNPAKLKFAFSESGLDERPQWTNGEDIRPGSDASPNRQDDEVKYNDRTHTLEFSPVALNALYALDTEILIMMARELGLTTEADKFQSRYERIKNSINNKLWSEEDGLYLNRHWDGRFSRRLSLENFYPLAAGIADEERARRMLKTLVDTRKFGGEQQLPFISRDDPAFASQGIGRGAIWSFSNYLLYVGLRRSGFNAEAAELARKSNTLARLSWDKEGKFFDYYSSQDGRGIEEGDNSQRPLFAGLMLWTGIEEVISADPWTGMSLGSRSVTEESRIERVKYSGANFDVISGPKRTVLRRDGNVEVECDGPVRIRSFRSTDRAIGFGIETKERVRLLVPAVEGRKITVSVDDKVLGSTSPGASASFKVPEGNHKVFIVK